MLNRFGITSLSKRQRGEQVMSGISHALRMVVLAFGLSTLATGAAGACEDCGPSYHDGWRHDDGWRDGRGFDRDGRDGYRDGYRHDGHDGYRDGCRDNCDRHDGCGDGCYRHERRDGCGGGCGDQNYSCYGGRFYCRYEDGRYDDDRFRERYYDGRGSYRSGGPYGFYGQ
jgi:hypothetical protein